MTSTPTPWADAIETHTSALFFAGDLAFKLKKPVTLGFLDYSTLERRKAACQAEVELNRRLAPDVYLGVDDVIGEDGEVREHLVVMRRMPASRRLSTLVERGTDVTDGLWQLAHLLAAFHAQAPRLPAADDAAGVDATASRWIENSSGLLPFAGAIFDPEDVAAVDSLARSYLSGRRSLFDQRVAGGRACDGHGDLLAEDIFLLDDGPRVLDCLEFDDRLRYGDVLADVAFLAMDLERLDRPDLGARFLVDYAHFAGDSWPSSLAHHHVAYRAQVRAKVAAIRVAQGDERSLGRARLLLRLARRHLDAARVRLVLVGGLPGTGKSTLARSLGQALGATVLRSDEVRKELAGLPTLTPIPAGFGEGLYAPERRARVYDELCERAEIALGLGMSVVLDASWADAGWRETAAAVASRTHSELLSLRCVAPPEVARDRLLARVPGEDPSDATPDVAELMAATADPWPQAKVVDTSRDRAASLAGALEHIGGAPRTRTRRGTGARTRRPPTP